MVPNARSSHRYSCRYVEPENDGSVHMKHSQVPRVIPSSTGFSDGIFEPSKNCIPSAFVGFPQFEKKKLSIFHQEELYNYQLEGHSV